MIKNIRLDRTLYLKIRVYLSITALLLIPSHKPAMALHEDFENQNYKRPALISVASVLAIYGMSRVDNSPIIFGTAYAVGALYLTNEWYKSESDITGLVVPFSLLTLSILNYGLFSDEDEYSKHQVFLYNTIGVGLIAAYAIWDHANPYRKPLILKNNRKIEIFPIASNQVLGAGMMLYF